MTPAVFKERAKVAFDYADKASCGFLGKREYKIAMAAVFGCRPDKEEVKQIFCTKDRISYEEFERYVCKKSIAIPVQIDPEMLFSLLDENYKGYLVLDDFCSASKFVDLRIPPSVWRMALKGIDRCRRGYIDFNEFLRILPTA